MDVRSRTLLGIEQQQGRQRVGAKALLQLAAVGAVLDVLERVTTRSGAAPAADPAALRLAVPAAKWMGNFFGTMHGGMIATIVAQAASLGVAANLRAGVGYQLVEFTVAFLRSPAVDGRVVTATVTPVKIGRRLSTVDVELHDADGMLLARATADARCDL